MACSLVTSNQTESLYLHLRNALFSADTSLFTRRLVIVPSPAMKGWLMQKLASDPDLGVAAGVEICCMGEGILFLENHLSASKGIIPPTHLEMALGLEIEIRRIIETADSVEHSIWHSLLTFLGAKEKLTRKTERRLAGLCNLLAMRFLQYGSYGRAMIQKWNNSENETCWQQKLWIQLFSSKHYGHEWHTEEERLQQLTSHPVPSKPPLQIHLFSFSHLPPPQRHFFERLAEQVAIVIYTLSPCQMFWSDILSDKESAHLQAFWRALGVSSQQQDDLAAFLRDRNPLLANFGKLGREHAIWLEEIVSDSFEDYVSSEATSALEAVQADMLLMHNSEKEEQSLILDSTDKSIQFHVAPSRWREVEILYNNLMACIARHPEMTPGDIIVMAPDILEYKPYIEAIFGNQQGSQLDYQIMDLHLQAQNQLVQGLQLLIDLALSRWDACSVVQLLEHPAFQRRHQLTLDDIDKIRRWINQEGIRWGEHSAHRNEILEQAHFREMIDNTSAGTWEAGFRNLLLSLSSTRDESGGIDFQDSALLGQVITLFQSLRADLAPLIDTTSMTASQWASYLHCLMKGYFAVEFSSSEQSALEEVLASLQQAGKSLSDASFSFSTIHHHLNDALERSTLTLRENHFDAVKFCSMLPMRAIPAKVIALIGMNDEAFPRKDHNFTLNLLVDNPDTDYCPSRTDLDRYLFLEAILSAREAFILSWQGNSEGEELFPSLVVTELLSYLKGTITVHPFWGFDSSYFATGDLCCYLNTHYQLACSRYSTAPHEPPRFIPEWFDPQPLALPESTIPDQDIFVDLRQLFLVAKNPVKSYLNTKLGMYLPREDLSQLDTEDPFTLSPLERAKMRRYSLRFSPEQILEQAELKGQLPPGLFKEVASQQVIQEIGEWQHNLQALSVDPSKLFHVELSRHCDQPAQIADNHWVTPPLEVDMGQKTTVKLVGQLTDLSPAGLLIPAKHSLTDALKAWPAFLVMQCLPQEWIPLCDRSRNLLLLKAGKAKQPFTDDHIPLLKSYLEYYFLCQHTCCPLLPEWIPDLLSSSTRADSDLREKTNNKWKALYNEEIKWVVNRMESVSHEAVLGAWREQAHALFDPIATHWFSKSKGPSKGPCLH